MKFFSRLFTPTSNKRLNELIGFLIFVAAVLLLLALASYSPLDPSLNTSATPPGSRPARNWIGVVGAGLSDILLQVGGISVFLVPVFMTLLAIRWFRSHKVESPGAKTLGAISLAIFFSAFLSLLPWHWRWMHAAPIEGLLGRIVGDALIHYFNVTGAYIVCLSAMSVALYLSTAFSFGALRLWFTTRFSFAFAAWERFEDWQQQRAKARAARDLEKKRAQQQQEKKAPVPVVQQKPAAVAPPAPAAPPQPRAKSGIERMMEDDGDIPAPPPGPVPLHAAAEPSVGTRADSETRSKTTMPKALGGWKLPSSALLHRPDERQEFDEEELKNLAEVLVAKCAEFDVRGAVTQINPGPVVTTFEFKPEAGIKYSRVTGLQEDLCLAMKAESILIERMAGICDVDGSGLITRPDDREEVVSGRLKEYEEKTLPLVKYYTGKGRLLEIDGDQDLDTVTAEALKAIENGNRL